MSTFPRNISKVLQKKSKKKISQNQGVALVLLHSGEGRPEFQRQIGGFHSLMTRKMLAGGRLDRTQFLVRKQ